MCYEFDGLVRKLRAFEQLRQDKANRAKATADRRQTEPLPPTRPAEPQPRVRERPTVPV